MIILHCLKEKAWEKYQNEPFYGEEYINSEGFIHCSDIHTFHLVAPHFAVLDERFVLLCIDIEKVQAEIKWEVGDDVGTKFPHIYGLLNLDSVVNVLPFLKDDENNFVLNRELQ